MTGTASSPVQGAPGPSALRADAAEFYPSVQQAASASGLGLSRKRSPGVAGLPSRPEQPRSPKMQRSMPAAAGSDAAASGSFPAEAHAQMPNGHAAEANGGPAVCQCPSNEGASEQAAAWSAGEPGELAGNGQAVLDDGEITLASGCA